MGNIISTKRVLIFIVLIIIVVIGISQINVVNKGVARLSATLYVNVKYNERDFKYQYTEFDTHFGDYFVTFKDKSDQRVSFTVIPKYFPVYVSYDPLDKPM